MEPGMSTHLFLGIGIGIGIFGRFAPAVAHFPENPFGYRHVMDRSAAAPITEGNVFW